MPFQKGHQTNLGRRRDAATKAAIGEKNSLRLHCPYCDLITTRVRLSHHIALKHPKELQYANFNDYFLQSLVVDEVTYQNYVIAKSTQELQKKLQKKFTPNYLKTDEDEESDASITPQSETDA